MRRDFLAFSKNCSSKAWPHAVSGCVNTLRSNCLTGCASRPAARASARIRVCNSIRRRLPAGDPRNFRNEKSMDAGRSALDAIAKVCGLSMERDGFEISVQRGNPCNPGRALRLLRGIIAHLSEPRRQL
jgi:hypothetical protein